MSIPSGTYRAVAVNYIFVITAANSDAVMVTFHLVEDPVRACQVAWLGSFCEEDARATLIALRRCGWTGADFHQLPGLGANEVDIGIETEADSRGLVRTRVRSVDARGAAGTGAHRQASFVEVTRLRDRLASEHKGAFVEPPPAPGNSPVHTKSSGFGVDR